MKFQVLQGSLDKLSQIRVLPIEGTLLRMNDPGTITRLVNKLSAGELLSHDDLFPVVYAELRGMARHRLQGEREAVPATELVHQVYVKLFGGSEQRNVRWESRAHFFGAAARAMEQLLIDAARRNQTRKKRVGEQLDGGNGIGFGRNGNGTRNGYDLDALASVTDTGDTAKVDVLILAEALRELSAQDADLAELVRLRIYLGQTVEGVAATLNRSVRTVHRDWALARAWLLRRMKEMGDTDSRH